jgi:hypothetical protein
VSRDFSKLRFKLVKREMKSSTAFLSSSSANTSIAVWRLNSSKRCQLDPDKGSSPEPVTSHAAQARSVTRIRSPDRNAVLAPAHVDQAGVLSAGAVLLRFCGLPRAGREATSGLSAQRDAIE